MPFPLVFCDSFLTYEPVMRLLGLWLDHGLTWKTYIKKTCASARRKANYLRKLKAKRLASNTEALMVLYKGWIRPGLEYACELYSTAAPSYLRQLEIVQAFALRIITGASPNTPHSILGVELKVSSLASRRSELILRKFQKIRCLTGGNKMSCLYAHWMFHCRAYEGKEAFQASSFFGSAWRTHFMLLNKHPTSTIPLTLYPPIPPPWEDNNLETPDIIPEFRKTVRNATRRVQKAEFAALGSVAFYRSLHPKIDKWPHTLSHNFLYAQIIFRLRSGYCRIGVHTGYAPFPPCPACGQTLDSIPHFLLQCPAYAVQRKILMQKVVSLSGKTPNQTRNFAWISKITLPATHRHCYVRPLKLLFCFYEICLA